MASARDEKVCVCVGGGGGTFIVCVQQVFYSEIIIYQGADLANGAKTRAF